MVHAFFSDARDGVGLSQFGKWQQHKAMPTIAYIGAIQVRIYYDDHGVPHFHAVSPEFDCKVAIEDGSVISGTGHLRGRDLAAIRAWGQKHRDVLTLNWQLAREGMPLQDIED